MRMSEVQPPERPDGQTRHEPASAADQIIPIKNPVALLSYYFGVFALIPLMGFFFGFAAVPMGAFGLSKVRQNPGLPGIAHAWVGIVLGSLSVAAHLLGAIWIMGNARR